MSKNPTNAPLTYFREENSTEKELYATHNFNVDGMETKVQTPIYKNGTEEEFLYMFREFVSMLDNYGFYAGNVQVLVRYRFLLATVKGTARDTWLDDDPVPPRQRDAEVLQRHLASFRTQILDEMAQKIKSII